MPGRSVRASLLAAGGMSGSHSPQRCKADFKVEQSRNCLENSGDITEHAPCILVNMEQRVLYFQEVDQEAISGVGGDPLFVGGGVDNQFSWSLLKGS